MADENKPPKIVFAPGAFDHFDGTQEELDEMVAEIMKMFEGKTAEEILAQSTPMTEEDFDDLPEDVQAQIMRSHFDDETGDLSDEFKRKLQ
jgi:hypothetical protein